MVDGEQTNETDTEGEKVNTPVEDPNKPVSEYDKALALVKRREEASKTELEILKQKKELAANEMLSGTSGGNIKQPTPEEKLQKQGEEGAKEIVDAFR